MSIYYGQDYILHYGVKGMKWGQRRYQNEDMSLTPEGKRRYSNGSTRDAVKAYSKQFDKASSMSDSADRAWAEAKSARKKMGKTAVGRTVASLRGKSDAAKKYNKLYDKASAMSDAADKEWSKANSMYKKTGKNFVSRIINNAKYD